jgi:uncharacterized protein YdeI (YjbR/CyaY-like superfamily)
MHPKVDAYIEKIEQWKDETGKLRKILLDCGLTEDLKWGKPCYAYEGKNVAVIQGFKEYFALLFFKGVLLSDPEGIMVRTGENTEVGRQLRFENAREIVARKNTIKAYVYEAIEVERSGLPMPPKKSIVPEELQERLDKSTALRTAFEALTPGRQRAYNIFFAQPKQAATRASRVEKYVPHILKGKGLNDD